MSDDIEAPDTRGPAIIRLERLERAVGEFAEHNLSTCASTSAFGSVSIDSIASIMADHERRWPKKDRCQRIAVNPLMMSALEKCKDPLDAPAFGVGLYGLPVYVRMDIPWRSWLAEMADGSSVLHYENGQTVRCLSAREFSETKPEDGV